LDTIVALVKMVDSAEAVVAVTMEAAAVAATLVEVLDPTMTVAVAVEARTLLPQ
jgi:hypothetical protein